MSMLFHSTYELIHSAIHDYMALLLVEKDEDAICISSLVFMMEYCFI